jgi:diguanylate cyclase (GGDEF)-like protein
MDKKIVHFMEYHESAREKAKPRAEKEKHQEEILLNKVQISIPISCKGEVWGFLSLNVKTSKDKLNHEYGNLFEIVENILADAMMKVETEKKINHQAYYDQLTDIPNRLLFSERLTQEINRAGETGKMIGIIFLDIDNFKNVNDTMGHEGGDQLLKLVSQKLVKSIKKTDTVSRFAGDEFMIMLTDIYREKEVVNVVNRIRGHFKNEFKVNEQNFYLSASLGVAIYPTDGETAEELIKSADIAMYKAKERGKNRYVLCSPDLKEEIRHKNELLGSIHGVLDRKELLIHYQPQVCLATGRIIAVEALLRWQHPIYNMVSPKTIIPLAEQTGMINPIGEWVLRTACRQNRQWQEMGLPQIRMAVNMSATQFRNPKLNSLIMRILKETDLKPKYLELELTENIAINRSDFIVGVLERLKKLGVFISIDDFGTEYSSLSRLKMLPIDQLKMDKQFVDGLAENEKDQAIANTIILLAKNLGLHVIAEGVETREQINFLQEHQCDSVQGFYYYQPMSAAEIENLLKSQKKQLVLLK